MIGNIRENRRKTIFPAIFLSTLFCLAPIVNIVIPHLNFHIPYLYICTGIGYIIYKSYRNCNNKLHTTWLDILIISIFFYNFSDILQAGNLALSAFYLTIYFTSKQTNSNHIRKLLIAGGCVQIALMLLQYSGLLQTNQEFFSITGSFDNPGILGGYLSICFSASTTFTTPIRKNWRLIFPLILALVLIATCSRGAWLAASIALLYSWMQLKSVRFMKQLPIYAACIVYTAILSLTLYKSDSAKGRLFIWQVGMEMIKSSPNGEGLGGFQREYMNHQASYLKQHPESYGNKLAMNNGLAFNEYLRIIYEQGACMSGFIIIGIICLSIQSIRKRADLFPCFLVFIIFAFFSYPCDIPLLSAAGMMLLGNLSYYCLIINKISIKWRKIALLSIIGILISHDWKRAQQLENDLHNFSYKDDYQSLQRIQDRYYMTRKYSPDFIFRYARILYLKGEYELAIPALKQAIYLYPTTDKYCDLGNSYQKLNKIVDAEKAYKQAVDLLPNLVYPHYCLFLLYNEQGKQQKAIETAKQVLQIQPKQNNERYKEIKEAIKKYLSVNSIDSI